MSVTQQIKDKLDIVQYVQQHVPDLKRAGRYYKACCPFHAENTPSFVVNPDTQSWRCFGACAEGGDIFTFAQKKHGWSFRDTLHELGEIAGVQVKQRTPQQQAREENLDRLRGMLQTAADFYHEQLLADTPEAQQTLVYTTQKRGFNHETITQWQIGYAPAGWSNLLDMLTNLGYSADDVVDAGLASRNDRGNVYDRFRNRLMIPISDERGRVIGFGARALAPDDTPKYLNSPQSDLFDKSSTLFGLDKAKQSIRDSETAVIVEGYMDVIQAHQAGYRNIVAQMGTAMTEAQLKLIVPRYAKKIILGLDQDDAGQNATRRSLEVARKALQDDLVGKLDVDIRVLQIDGAKDPDDVLRETPDKWAEYIKAAMPVADFVIDMEAAGLAPNASLQERQAVAENVLPILTASENNIYKQENIQRLALRLRIPENDLMAWAQELRRIEQSRQQQRQRYQDKPPPVQDEYGASSEEPPPLSLNFDEDDIPPDFDDESEFAPQVRTPAPKRRMLTTSNISPKTEADCLRVILYSPQSISLVNRKFRELADGNPSMLAGPLCELDPRDFGIEIHRTLLATIQEALSQEDSEMLEYLREEFDEILVEQINELMQDDEARIASSLQNRQKADLEDVFGKTSRTGVSSTQLTENMMKHFLDLRVHRLKREHNEIRFMMEDAQQNQDKEAEKLYFAQAFPITQALNRLNKGKHELEGAL